jgi:hypothetical protein
MLGKENMKHYIYPSMVRYNFRNPAFMLAVAAIGVLFLSGCHANTASTAAPIQPVVSDRPLPTAKFQFGDSRDGAGERMMILGYQQAYIAAGGPQNRGKKFEQLMNYIIQYSLRYPLSDFQVFALLGAPDRVAVGNGDAMYCYSCDHRGLRDWTFEIDVSKDGNVFHIGQNDTKSMAIEDVPKFPGWPTPHN